MPPKWTEADWASTGRIVIHIASSVVGFWLLGIVLQPALPLIGFGVAWAFAHWYYVGPIIWSVGWFLTR